MDEKPGEKAFRKDIEYVIKQLMKRDVDPTPDAIFDFCRTHPADVKTITRIRARGQEDFLRIWLLLWGRTRDRIRATIPAKKIQEATE